MAQGWISPTLWHPIITSRTPSCITMNHITRKKFFFFFNKSQGWASPALWHPIITSRTPSCITMHHIAKKFNKVPVELGGWTTPTLWHINVSSRTSCITLNNIAKILVRRKVGHRQPLGIKTYTWQSQNLYSGYWSVQEQIFENWTTLLKIKSKRKGRI